MWLKPLVLVTGILLVGSPLAAQGRGSFQRQSTVTLAYGSLRYEPSDNTRFPLVAVRLDQTISRWARFETAASFSRPEVQTDAIGQYDPTLPTERSSLFSVTVGALARWDVGPVEPYGGLAIGIFIRRDSDSDGRRFSRTAFAFPFGVRVKLTDRFGVRGEIRFREDAHEVVTRSDREMTIGVTWTR